jgi:FixJ family two-component response regulator
MEAMMEPAKHVFVVDRDPNTVACVRLVCSSLQADCGDYATPEQFLRAYDRQTPGCLVAEIRPAAATGSDLQQRLADERIRLPVIFVTAETDIGMVTRVMRGGAVTVLQKPLDEPALRTALREALARDAEIRRIDAAHASLRRRIAGLSRRERSVLRSMMEGKPASRIAADLNVDVSTIDDCLSGMLRKTQCATLIDLARLAVEAEIDVETD